MLISVQGRKKLANDGKTMIFSHDIFGFDSFEYQKFADVWAIGNCTVDLTDKIKFLREIAGMLEER